MLNKIKMWRKFEQNKNSLYVNKKIKQVKENRRKIVHVLGVEEKKCVNNYKLERGRRAKKLNQLKVQLSSSS